MDKGETDTIVALSSGFGRAGVAVIRVSGPQSSAILQKLTDQRLPKIRQAVVRWLYDVEKVRLDQALTLRFEGPESFTGEDIVEIHCHGSIAVIEAVIGEIVASGLARPANPGEFSQRAFENGRMDLVQAEGIADLIDATGREQMRQAARFVAGDASETLELWRKSLLEASALLAASIDFSDEGDVPDDAHDPVLGLLSGLECEFKAALKNADSASRVRDGIRIAILGKPNAGKSTLINALTNRDAVIVSDIPGTTRDIVENQLVLNGIPVTLADTAGLRETDDPIEEEGVRRARKWADQADLRIYLDRADEYSGESRPDILGEGDLWVASQTDRTKNAGSSFPHDLTLSVSKTTSLDVLKGVLESRVKTLTRSDDTPIIVRLRHKTSLKDALDAIDRAQFHLIENGDVDLAAFEVSIARSALDQILGRVDVEEILGEVFSGFCVGK